jgi:serine/threonine-protein kinase RsbW
MEKKLKIKSDLENLREVEKAIDDITVSAKISHSCYGKILVAVLEAVNNAIAHGNKFSHDKFVDISLKCRGEKLTVVVKDKGAGFSPDTIPDPTLPENIEKFTGRGVFLMTKLADEIKFNKKGNTVTFVFNNINC